MCVWARLTDKSCWHEISQSLSSSLSSSLFHLSTKKKSLYVCSQDSSDVRVFFYYGRWTHLYNVYVTYPLFFLKYSLYFNRSGDGSGDGVSRYIEFIAFKFRYSFLPFLFIHFYILYSAAVLACPNGLHLQKMDRRTVGNSKVYVYYYYRRNEVDPPVFSFFMSIFLLCIQWK